MKKLALAALLIVLLPLLMPLVAMGLVVALWMAMCSWLWLVYFCWSHADRVYMICSRRRGWEPFLSNNVVPALPPQITAVWLETPRQPAGVVRAVRASNTRLSKPFVVLVTPFGIRSVPLNERLRHLKRFGKRSVDVAADARAVIDEALADFAAWERRGIFRE